MVGDGQRIKFWKDRWCGDTPLNIAFHSLFTCVCVKEAWVGEVWSVEQGRGVGILPSSDCSMIGKWSM